jgi:F-type H+-transporting ATPase subunit alpha
LLALTAGLFDLVPLAQMIDAEHAVEVAASNIAPEVIQRLDTAEKLSDEDRNIIIDIARQALANFQPKSETKPNSKPEADSEPESKPVNEAESKNKT